MTRRSVETAAMSTKAAITTATSTSSSQSFSSQSALIFLHGLGDSPAGWSSLRQSLPMLRPTLQDIHYVFPSAPIIPIDINGGSRMPGWFDLFDWPIRLASRDDRDGMLRAVQHIREQVQILHESHGIPKSRIVLGGFSQGGAIALLTTYLDDEAYAGCVSLSGWLTLRDELHLSDAAKSTPLFWGHGSYDDKVLFEQQAHGIKVLTEKGVTAIRQAAYPIGHSSCSDETSDMADFLESVLAMKISTI